MTEIITGTALGVSILYVFLQFKIPLVVYRKWIDLALIILLIWIVITIKTNFVVAITTWASISFSLLIRIAEWKERRKNK